MQRLHAVLGVHAKTRSLIIHDLHAARPFFCPTDADAPLRVDQNTVLTGAVTAQCFQLIARQRGKVAKRHCAVQKNQSTHGVIGEALKRRGALPLEEAARISIPETPNHAS